MSRNLTLTATFLALAILGAALAWLLVAGGAFENLGPALPWMIAGAIVVAALTALLMRLAFFSSRRGYDRAHRLDKGDGAGPL